MLRFSYYFSCGVVALLSTHLIRFEVLGVPIIGLDVLLLLAIVLSGSVIGSLWSTLRENGDFPRLSLWGSIGIVLFLVGIFVSAAQDGFTLRELGILKSWFVLPMVFAGVFVWVFRDKITGVLDAYALGASGVAIWSVMGMVWGWGVAYDGRLSGWYDSPNQLALYLAPAWLWIVVSLRTQKGHNLRKMTRTARYASFCILGVALALTFSHGAILGLLASLGWFFYVRSVPQMQRALRISLPLLLGVCVFGMWWVASGTGDAWIEQERSSLASRAMIWRSAVEIGKENPLLGVGSGNFQEWYLSYQQYYPPYLEWAVPHPHNIYLALWIYSGLIGLIGFFCILIGIFRRGLVIFEIIPFHDMKNETFYGLAFCVLLLVWGLVDVAFVWSNDMSVVLWIVVLAMIIREPSRIPNSRPAGHKKGRL